MKIDRRKNYYLLLDTETFNGIDNALTYDVGFAIINKKGNVYEAYSYIVEEIYSIKEMQETCYYKEKMPRYARDIKDGTRQLVSFWTVRRKIWDLLKKYDITAVVAHNARFDYNALNTTIRYITSSKSRYFFPYGTKIYCTLAMSRSTLGKEKMYNYFCNSRGYLTKYNKIRFTAEIIYRFLTQDEEFIESHTALEDVMIEKEIFKECINKHKKIQKTYWNERPPKKNQYNFIVGEC